jgi:hypothetical protein
VEGIGKVSKSTVAMATFWLALAKVRCGVPSWLMAAAALAQARALVNSMVTSRSVSVAQSAGCQGLLARWQAHPGVELPTARRRSVMRGLALAVPPGKLVVDWRGTPFLAGVLRSAS